MARRKKKSNWLGIVLIIVFLVAGVAWYFYKPDYIKRYEETRKEFATRNGKTLRREIRDNIKFYENKGPLSTDLERIRSYYRLRLML